MSDSESFSANEDQHLSSETNVHSNDILKDVWQKTDLKVNDEKFLETTRLNIIFNNPDSVTEVSILIQCHTFNHILT